MQAIPLENIILQGLLGDVKGCELFHFTASSTAHTMKYDLNVLPGGSADIVIVEVTPQLPASTVTPLNSQWQQIQQTSATNQSNIDLYPGYITWFGPLIAGRKVFIRAYCEDQSQLLLGRNCPAQVAVIA